MGNRLLCDPLPGLGSIATGGGAPDGQAAAEGAKAGSKPAAAFASATPSPMVRVHGLKKTELPPLCTNFAE